MRIQDTKNNNKYSVRAGNGLGYLGQQFLFTGIQQHQKIFHCFSSQYIIWFLSILRVPQRVGIVVVVFAVILIFRAFGDELHEGLGD